MNIGLTPSEVRSLFASGAMGFAPKPAPEPRKTKRFPSSDARHAEYIHRRDRFFAAGLTADGTPRKREYPLTFSSNQTTTKAND